MKRGKVYLAASNSGIYKIGFSFDLNSRKHALRSPSGDCGKVLHAIRSKEPRWLERVLHAHFRTKRIVGEWFRLTESDIAAIRSVRQCDDKEDLPEWLSQTLIPHPSARLAACGWRGKNKSECPLALSLEERLGIGACIKALRKSSGLTIGDVASLVGTPCSTIDVLEAGKRKVTASILSALATVFGVTAGDLLEAALPDYAI